MVKFLSFSLLRSHASPIFSDEIPFVDVFVMQDWEQKLRDSTEQLSCLERERKDLQDQVQKDRGCRDWGREVPKDCKISGKV